MGTVTEIWRYPVKSMQGERVPASPVTLAGLTGDRAYAVVDQETGDVGSAKHPRLWGALLRCRARYIDEPPGEVEITLPDGTVTRSGGPGVDERLSEVFGRPVYLSTAAPEGNRYLAVWPELDGVIPADVRSQLAVDGDEAEGTLTGLTLGVALPGTLFDVAALHLLTTATLRRLVELEPGSNFAVERFRPNVVIDGDGAPFAENGWTGASLSIGDDGLSGSVLLPTMRCIMTTLDQDQLPRDGAVLRAISKHNRIELPGLGTWSCVGAYAAVETPGQIRVGDQVVGVS
jgi:uncharacterized protein YcbX